MKLLQTSTGHFPWHEVAPAQFTAAAATQGRDLSHIPFVGGDILSLSNIQQFWLSSAPLGSLAQRIPWAHEEPETQRRCSSLIPQFAGVEITQLIWAMRGLWVFNGHGKGMGAGVSVQMEAGRGCGTWGRRECQELVLVKRLGEVNTCQGKGKSH